MLKTFSNIDKAFWMSRSVMAEKIADNDFELSDKYEKMRIHLNFYSTSSQDLGRRKPQTLNLNLF